MMHRFLFFIGFAAAWLIYAAGRLLFVIAKIIFFLLLIFMVWLVFVHAWELGKWKGVGIIALFPVACALIVIIGWGLFEAWEWSAKKLKKD